MATTSTSMTLLEEILAKLDAVVAPDKTAEALYFIHRQQDIAAELRARTAKQRAAGLIYPVNLSRREDAQPGSPAKLGVFIDIYTSPVLRPGAATSAEIAEAVWAQLDGWRPAGAHHYNQRLVARDAGLVADTQFVVWRLLFEGDRVIPTSNR